MDDKFKEKMREVGQLLGYYYVIDDDRTCPVIKDCHEHTIFFREWQGKVSITGCFPRDEIAGYSITRSPSINVSNKRSVFQFIRDIQRRLLPQYYKQFNEAVLKIAENKANYESRNAYMNRFCNILGSEIRAEDKSRLKTYQYFGDCSLDVADMYGKSYELKIRTCPDELTGIILQTISKYYKENEIEPENES